MKVKISEWWWQNLFIPVGIIWLSASVAGAGCDITNLTASIDLGASTETQWSVVLTFNMKMPTCNPGCTIGWARHNAATGEVMGSGSGGGLFPTSVYYDANGNRRQYDELLNCTNRMTFSKSATGSYVVFAANPFKDCTGGFMSCNGESDTTTVYLPPVVAGYCPLEVKNPINLTTGNKSSRKTDLTIETPAGTLSFDRSYNGLGGNMGDGRFNQGPLEYGWHMSFDYTLRVTGTSPNRQVAARVEGSGLFEYTG